MKKYLPIILLVIGLGVGFTGGYFFKNFQQNKLRNNLRNGAINGQRFSPNGVNSGQNRGGMMFGGGVEGEILSIDDKTLIVKLVDGSTKIIMFSDSTTYSNLLASKKTDLKQRTKILVFGKPNSDGSVTADRIQFTNATLK